MSTLAPILCLLLGLTAAFCPGARAEGLAETDARSAVIFTYFAVGNDDNPAASVTAGQFKDQIAELKSGGYTVLPVPEIAAALRKGRALPPHTVGLTFDGADRSVIETAWPILAEAGLPFTVFLPSGAIESGKPPVMTWDDLRKLKKSGLVSFGLHPALYDHGAGTDIAEVKRQINSARASVRDNLEIEPSLFAYPYGEYTVPYKSLIRAMGFAAAFGQQSGAAYPGADPFALPRFSVTERYGDLGRFIMAATSLPLPVTDVSPADPFLKTDRPAVGFTADPALAANLKALSCYAGDERPAVETLRGRVELRFKNPVRDDRLRLNCTMQAAPENGQPRWRWLGLLFTMPPGGDTGDADPLVE